MSPDESIEPSSGPEPGTGGLTPTRPGLALTLVQFRQTINGIRELLAAVTPHVTELSSLVQPEVRAVLDSMSKDQIEMLRVVTQAWDDAEGEETPSLSHSDNPEETLGPNPPEADGGAAAQVEPSTTEAAQVAPTAEESTTTLTAAVEQPKIADAPVEATSEQEQVPGPDTAEQSPTKTTYDWEALEARAKAGELGDDELTVLVNEVFSGQQHLLFQFFRESRKAMVDPDKEELLNGSMLVTAVAAFETLVAGVLGQQFVEFPGLLERSEKEFSLADLQQFDSIDDARRAAVEQRVDRFMRDGFDSWDKWFTKNAGIELSGLAIDPKQFNEVLQRRNVVVHNAGRASRQYLATAPAEFCTGLGVGDFLPVGSEYLDRALDELMTMGTALASLAWHKWFPDERSEVLLDLNRSVYGLLETERYAACIKLASIAVPLEGSAWNTEASRVNAWIARKQLHGTDSIKAEVVGWDVSALSPEFLLAKTALLDQYDTVFDLLPDMLDQGVLAAEQLETWPLLRGAREDPRFGPILEAEQKKAD